MPVAARKLLGTTEPGAKLQLIVRDDATEATVKPLMTLDDIQTLTRSLIDPTTPPLEDARALYETREPR